MQTEKQGRKGRMRIISDQVQIGYVVITPKTRREREREKRRERSEMRGGGGGG